MTRRAVVTGAGSGIGAETCRQLRAQGWTVIGIDLTAGDGINRADVTDLDQLEAVAATLEGAQVDALLCVAGIWSGRDDRYTTVPLDVWNHTFAVNVTGTMLTMRAFAPLLVEGSSVVTVASMAALTGIPKRDAYTASKGAIVALTRAWAADLIRLGIRVNCIAIGTAVALIASGQYDVIVAVGAEKMPAGFIPRPPGASDSLNDTDFLRWIAIGASNPAYWALEARRRMFEYGTSEETFAQAVTLMRRNGVHNPLARFRSEPTPAEVLGSKVVTDPLHLLEICAVSDGAAAVVLVSAEHAKRLDVPLIEVAGAAMTTGTFGDRSVRIPTISQNARSNGQPTSEVRSAVDRALTLAGVDRADVDILEFADNSAWHILSWPEQLGYLNPGESDAMIAKGVLGNGRTVFNPSGGFLSFGEATTAQGILQVCELVWQLRGTAGELQVEGARVAQTAVLGLGSNGASIVLRSAD